MLTRILVLFFVFSGLTLLPADDKKPPAPEGFSWKPVTDKSLGLWEGKRPVFVYNHGVISREGVAPRYNRSSYLHPVYGLDGEVISDDFPKDHFHHRGICWAWPHVTVDGKHYDLWACVPGIRNQFEKWTCKEAGKEKAVLGLENSWRVGDKKVVREQLKITVHPAAVNSRSIDFELTWTALDKPVTLQGAANKSYGGFNMRYAMKGQTSRITVPSGPTKKDLAITKLKWVDFTSPFKGAPGESGAAIFIHPSHPGYPPTWLTRHYGILCVGWPGVKPDTLQPGKPVRCRYRVWVHRGRIETADLKRAYEEYIQRDKKDTR